MSELLNCFFFQEVIKNVFQIARMAGKNKKQQLKMVTFSFAVEKAYWISYNLIFK